MQISRRRRTLGVNRGPNVLTNGDFAAGATGWTVSNADGTHIVTFSGGTLRFQSDTLSPALTVSQAAVMTVGKMYEVTVVVAAAALPAGIKSDALSGGPVIATGAPGTYVTKGIAATAAFTFTRAASNVDITLDSITLREVFRQP